MFPPLYLFFYSIKINIYFKLHPLMPQVHTKMLDDDKGLLIKHIKAPAIVKVEFIKL